MLVYFKNNNLIFVVKEGNETQRKFKRNSLIVFLYREYRSESRVCVCLKLTMLSAQKHKQQK